MWKLEKEDAATIRELGAHVQAAEQEIYRRRGILFRAARRLADGCDCAIADVGINFRNDGDVVVFDSTTHLINDVVKRPVKGKETSTPKPMKPRKSVND